MAHQDISDARQLITEIDFPTDRLCWAWWTPGDATRYHVTLINAAPSASATGLATNGTFRALVITIDLFGSQPTSIVIPRPADDDERYTADEWVHRNYPGGWWPGIRPLLAALGWTLASDHDTTYRSTDHRDIATAEREQNVWPLPPVAHFSRPRPGLAADKAHQPARNSLALPVRAGRAVSAAHATWRTA